LYGVAYRTALEARSINDRRRSRERHVPDMPHPEVTPPEAQDWRPLLDRELNDLHENYRAAVILCDLEGHSRKCQFSFPTEPLLRASRANRNTSRFSRLALTQLLSEATGRRRR
jgi:hypothetical protein